MYKKTIFFGMVSLLFLIPLTSNATALRLEPVNQAYDYGDTINVDLRADIDQSDAIFGFGFDLSFDGGSTFVLPGEEGEYLTFIDFVAETSFEAPAFWDDGDTISGEVPWGNSDVWGSNILLGTFSFTAPTVGVLGTETIALYPLEGDYGLFGEEGLIGRTALMPNNPTATMNPVPEPAAMFMFGTGLIGLLGVIRKVRK